MSRCHLRLTPRGARRGEEQGGPSFSPEILLLVPPSSSHLLPPSPHLPQIQNPLPPLVGAPFASHPPQESGCLEVAVEILDQLLPSPQKLRQQIRHLCYSSHRTFGKPRTPELRPSSRCPQAQSHRVSGAHQRPARGPGCRSGLCCPGFRGSG